MSMRRLGLWLGPKMAEGVLGLRWAWEGVEGFLCPGSHHVHQSLPRGKASPARVGSAGSRAVHAKAVGQPPAAGMAPRG